MKKKLKVPKLSMPKLSMPKLSPRTVRLLAFGVPILVVLVVVIYIVIHSGNRWEDTELRFTKRLEEVEAETWERPALHGERMRGEAWDHYVEILGKIPPELPDVEAFDRLILEGDVEALQAVRPVLERFGDVGGTLRRGSRSRVGGRPVEWR
ncbi:MAG: hypothetical protein ACYTAF_02540, partial [Planctomycetota bacterium]